MWVDDDLTALARDLQAIKKLRAANAKERLLAQRAQVGFVAIAAAFTTGGIAAFVIGAPWLGTYAVVGACSWILASYLPFGFGYSGITRRIPLISRLGRRLRASSSAQDAITRITAQAPLPTTDADFGPNGRQVARLLALLESLTPAQWRRLRHAFSSRSFGRYMGRRLESRDRQLAALEGSLERRIARKREAPWDTEYGVEPDVGSPEVSWTWGYLAALRRLSDIRVSGRFPPEAALLPVRAALMALVRRGSIEGSEFAAEYAPLRDALGRAADDVTRPE